jgi:hypothetical protein
LAAILDELAQDIYVNDSLASFLSTVDTGTADYYLRSGYQLKLKERLDNLKFRAIVKKNVSKNIAKHVFLKKIKGFDLYCNKDVSNIADFSTGMVGYANPFFLSEGDNYFLAISTIVYNELKGIAGTPFFQGVPVNYGFSCQIAGQIYFYSFKSADPAKLLLDFVNNTKDFTISQLMEEMNRPRKLRLDGPRRIIYEAERLGSDLSSLYQLGHPIHFARKLGGIWIYDDKLSTAVLDNRVAAFCN